MSKPAKVGLLEELKPLLKAQGFRKTRTTWHRISKETIAVFNVQTSQWDSDVYYINVGVYVREIGDRTDPPEYECHVRRRVRSEGKTTGQIVDEALRWFADRASVAQVKALAEVDSNYGLVSLVDIRTLN
jgi:hypothetical protein